MTDREDLISLDELATTLRAWEGPPRPQARAAQRRRLRLGRALAAGLATAGIAVGGTVGALSLLDGSENESSRVALQHVELPPLPPGPTRIEGARGMAVIQAVSLDEMIKDADVVFVGTVSEIGGAELIDSDRRPVMRGHRVRYAIERVLRGNPVDAIDVTSLALPEAAFSAELGETYLVFAEWRALGNDSVRRLVPSGYSQGVYQVVAPGQASNAANGTVHIDTVADRIATAG